MTQSKRLFVLFLIFAAALTLRLWNLGNIPYGVTPDELSQGYSAKSLVQTGRDEWGRLDIWYFKSFLDDKSPIQTYLMTIPVALFGLSVWSTRLIPAIMGSFGCVFLSLFAYQLTKNKIKGDFPLVAGAFLVISFWHFAFSRMALEANIAMTFFYIGGYLFLATDRLPAQFGALLFFALSMLTYHATKLFVPMIFIGLAAYKTNLNLTKIKRYIPMGAAIATIFYITVFGQAASRSWELSILSYLKNPPEIVKDIQYRSDLNKVSPKLTRIFDNKFSFVLDMGFENYMSYYSPAFWFSEGGREITYSIIPGTGLMAWWMPLLIIAGFFFLIYKKQYKLLCFLIFWLLCAGIPAALTKEGYRPNRAISFMGVFEILAAFGFVSLLSVIPNKKIFAAGFMAIAAITFIVYLDDYAFASQIKYPTHMGRQWRETFEYLKDSKVADKYKRVMVDRDGQKQAYVGFFLDVEAKDFQLASAGWNEMLLKNPQVQYLDQLNGYELGKFRFSKLAFPEMREIDTLYITDNLAVVPKDAKIIKTIESTKRQPLVEIFEFVNEETE
jgi:hypothetical protein